MNELSLVIAAAGQATRWGGGTKLLAPIAGTPLIVRTILQFQSHHPDAQVYVVTGNAVVEAAVEDLPHTRVLRARTEDLDPLHAGCRCVVETMMAAREAWEDGGWLLWGDVAWTTKGMGTVCHEEFMSPGITTFISRSRGELFGFRVRPAHAHRMWKALYASYEDWLGKGRGKGWEAYRALWDMPLRKHRIKKGTAIRIMDHTNDIDTRVQYRRFCKCERVSCE